MASAKNSATAFYMLAECYLNGRGVKTNKGYALTNYQKSAAMDYSPAKFQIGECYYWGYGTPMNWFAALESVQSTYSILTTAIATRR